MIPPHFFECRLGRGSKLGSGAELLSAGTALAEIPRLTKEAPPLRASAWLVIVAVAALEPIDDPDCPLRIGGWASLVAEVAGVAARLLRLGLACQATGNSWSLRQQLGCDEVIITDTQIPKFTTTTSKVVDDYSVQLR